MGYRHSIVSWCRDPEDMSRFRCVMIHNNYIGGYGDQGKQKRERDEWRAF